MARAHMAGVGPGLYNGAMQLIMVGLSHKTAPLAVREAAAYAREGAVRALTELLAAAPAIAEAALLSTCHRTEIYAAGAPEAGLGQLRAVLEQRLPATPERERWLYSAVGEDAARQLARVAAGLDSLILGEAQILGQVREALRLSEMAGTVGPVLSRLFQDAIAVGKRVRHETGLGDGAASIGYAAVELAKALFGRLEGTRALLVGAGKMSELAVKNLAAAGVSEVVVANRTRERALALAAGLGRVPQSGPPVRWVPLEELVDALCRADIVISSTGAPGPILLCEHVKAALAARGDRPLFLIDIAVPRDIEPTVADLPGAFLYNIDDLQRVVDHNLGARAAHVSAAERLVRAGVSQFVEWLAERRAVPVIAAMRGRAAAICRQEVERALRQLGHLSEADRETIVALGEAIVKKLLHEPTVRLKRVCAAHPDGDERAAVYLRVAQELFGLSDVALPRPVESDEGADATGERRCEIAPPLEAVPAPVRAGR
ncbi:MAG TPA: glutamyl-tRNA reductase [Limnochordia bacterium]